MSLVSHKKSQLGKNIGDTTYRLLPQKPFQEKYEEQYKVIYR
jgi:hypothetical protein